MTTDSAKDSVHVRVRLRAPLHATLRDSAEHRGNSLNAEITRRLQKTVDEEQERAESPFSDLVETVTTALRTGLRQGARHQVRSASVRDLDDLAQGFVNVPDRSLDDLAQDRWCYAHAMNYVAAALDAYMPLGDTGEDGELTEKREAENELRKSLAGANVRRALDRQQGEDEGDGDSGHD